MVMFIPTTTNNTRRGSPMRKGTRSRPVVRFAPPTPEHHQIHQVESIPQECYAEYHYTSEELLECRRKEIASIESYLNDKVKAKAEIEIESDQLTWRGIEDYRYGRDKNKHCKLHAMRVLKECRRQRRAGMVPNAHLLKHISQTSSLQDTRIAIQRATNDAVAVAPQQQQQQPAMRSSTGSMPTTQRPQRQLPSKAVSRSLVMETTRRSSDSTKANKQRKQRTLSPLPQRGLQRRSQLAFCKAAFL